MKHEYNADLGELGLIHSANNARSGRTSLKQYNPANLAARSLLQLLSPKTMERTCSENVVALSVGQFKKSLTERFFKYISAFECVKLFCHFLPYILLC